MRLTALLALPLAASVGGCAGYGAAPAAHGTGDTSQVIGALIPGEVTTLTAAELAPLVSAGTIVLVDVRTPLEYASGHITGAVNRPLAGFDPFALPDPDEGEVILYCRSSARSGEAARQYGEATGLSIRHLEGGIVAWKDAGLPVVVPQER